MIAPAQRRAAKVLVVDDDVGVRDCLAMLLEEEGYEVCACASPKEGLFQLMSQQWDLVLTDYSMPDHTGLWMLEEAERAQSLDCPAVIVTALASQLPGNRFPVMTKPVEPRELIALCREQIRQHAPEAAPVSFEFSLYVSDGSAACARAKNAITAFLDAHGRAADLEIIDLSKGGLDRAAADRVTFTPTLIRRKPSPVWVVGVPKDLSSVLL